MNNFPQYTVDYISKIMSLRTPQIESLKRLDTVLKSIKLAKNTDLNHSISIVNSIYPTCSDFEHEFMSLAFALATGVGKTRLMGAFITYLYTNHNIKNFFIVAPGKTVYDKLREDLGTPGTSKYVFKGVGCFSEPPMVITDIDYRTKQLFDSGINLYIYNIDKFNKESSKMNQANEYLGESFIKKLSSLNDLVLIMDESHHYRADKGLSAINELKPVLGLELTATPMYTDKGKSFKFKNVIFEYPLSKAIEDGYTRTPYALTRKDMPDGVFGDEELDHLMIDDGITYHEKIKKILKNYAETENKKLVKPFVLIVCKDTNHAEKVLKYVTSTTYKNGYYSDKTIIVHSKQTGTESDENTQKLLSVEAANEPTEIVIHVNKLKEGWDVNNLYTIIPLRAATSDILKEQMVGRGLRLPFGTRTGDKYIDSVMLTAHDKFRAIIEAAQRGESIFKKGNIIDIKDLSKTENILPSYTPPLFTTEEIQELSKITNEKDDRKTEEIIHKTNTIITELVTEEMKPASTTNSIEQVPQTLTENQKKLIEEKFTVIVEESKDIGDIINNFKDPFMQWVQKSIDKVYKKIQDNFIPIPNISITSEGHDDYHFVDFDLDFSDLNYIPVQNQVLIQNLIENNDISMEDTISINLNINPQKTIITLLREKPEIDYDSSSNLLHKLVNQFCELYQNRFGSEGLKNIVFMYKNDITNKIYQQLLMDNHFYCSNPDLFEEVTSIRKYNYRPSYTSKTDCNLYDDFKDKTEGSIKSVLFHGIKKSVFESAKFDSYQELLFAIILEREDCVEKWLRPAPNEFNITYNHGKKYEPDFVVETADTIYLVEVKDSSMVNNPIVQAKKERALHYCQLATDYDRANGLKDWHYMLIPHNEITVTTSFDKLVKLFKM